MSAEWGQAEHLPAVMTLTSGERTLLEKRQPQVVVIHLWSSMEPKRNGAPAP
jgi:hypothetical protein